MKVYFTASIYHRKDFLREYKKIIDTLKKLGISEVFSEDIIDISLPDALSESDSERKKWYNTWSNYIQKSDFVVAEISYPSTINVGFEINSILERGKPVVGLYRKGSDPIFTSELHSKRLIKSCYTTETLEDVLKWAIGEAREIINRRFTFILPPDINQFLDNTFHTYGITTSDLIRNLIRKEMINHQKKKIKK